MGKIDTNYVIELYKSGVGMKEIRDIIGCDWRKIQTIIKDAGLYGMLKRKLWGKESEIISRYISGESELALSKSYNVSRRAIERVLTEGGIERRSGSQANLIRFQNATEEERKEITKSANDAMRKLPKEFHHQSSVKQALTKFNTKSKVGKYEVEVTELLSQFNPIPQFPVDVYNIDIACGRVAVEVEVRTSYPHRVESKRKRIKEIAKRGWGIVYLVINRKGLNAAGLDQLYRIVEFASRDESSIGKYWVIDGTGKLIASGCLNGDDLTVIDAPNDILDNIG